MILYLDTSVVVAALTPEVASSRADRLLKKYRDDGIVISDWVETEVASALALKVRTQQIDTDQKRAAQATFSELTMALLSTLPVTSMHFRMAAQFAGRPELALRASDALHVAICADHSATMATLDERLATAARAVGVAVEMP